MKLRLMTYNIHRAIGVDRRFRPQRIVDIVGHYEPQVVLLQEVDDGAPRSQRLDLARELATSLGFPHFAVGHNVSLRKGRYGNATLSQYPIAHERNIDLSIDARKRRGCQHTTLRVDDGAGGSRELEVFNVHLGLSAQERARQVGLLVNSNEFGSCDTSVPCIVGGDFNDWRSLLHPIFTEILRFHCSTQRDHTYDVGVRTYPSFSPRGGLDRVYFRGPIKSHGARSCRLRLSRVASDHLPVIVDFELTS